MVSNNEELKARFCPEGSVLRRHQNRMTEILLVFDAICKKHNIQYWLSSGTLLGCVRHGGYIPWDDDLDVEMMREDYLRLLEVLPDELPGNLALQNHDTDPNYFFSYPKIRDLKSHLEEVNRFDQIFKYQGIYIDVFLMEKSPTWLQKLSCDTIGHIYKVLKNTSLGKEEKLRKVHWWYTLNHRFIYPLFRFMSRFSSSQYVHHTFGTPYPKERSLKEVFPLTTAVFEGHDFPVPHDADKYLRRMYGDYMKLPNIDELHPHYDKLEFL